MRTLSAFWHWLVRTFVRIFFFRLSGGFRVLGARNVPRKGPLIVSPNHVSHLDPPAAACALPRKLSFMAKAELFDHKLFGALIRSFGSFPVRRGEGDMEAIRTAIRMLNEGHAVLMFPEGTRGDGKHLLPFNKGVGMIAKRSGAAVLPVGISGTHRKWPKGGKKPKWGRVTVAFGAPMRYEDFSGETESEIREAFARELERRIRELCSAGGYELETPHPLKEGADGG
jgi:1-acyl-sn-glycerol-3-phosphate acyltransferase